MKALILCPRSDPAGTGIGIKEALERHSLVTARQVRQIPRHYAYPHDAEWSEVDSLTAWADVVHVMEIAEALPRSKPAVLHHHGNYFRTHRARLMKARAKHVCSTLDLELLDGGEWLPAPYDLEWLSRFRKQQPVLTIAHAGTEPDSKSTAPFLDACERLGKEMPVKVLHIQGVSWIECLWLKGTADIYFDQVLTGYGNNAIEAWGMGIPVVAGIEPAEARKRGHLIPDETPDEMRQRWGGLPFLRADEGSIYDALLTLAEPSMREEWAERGLQHVERWHDQRVVAAQLASIYKSIAA